MKFLDEVKIYVQAGCGGNGCVSFRREKYVPKGGPDGGDGGNGGDVTIRATASRQTLTHLSYQKHYLATSGAHGKGKKKTGSCGESLILEVPVGTFIKLEDGSILADLDLEGAEVVVAKGGRGGWGNVHFANSVNQTPRIAIPGKQGEEKTIVLELKLLADVGLVGFPNAGKSTLLSSVSKARPRIASFPFSTLSPHLGVVVQNDTPSFIMADIPGLIEGAHLGAGLGHKFLKHIERTRLLIFVLDISDLQKVDPLEHFQTLMLEISQYNASLLKKPYFVVLNKIDVVEGSEFSLKPAISYFEKMNITALPVSAKEKIGLEHIICTVDKILNNHIDNNIQYHAA